MPQRVPCLLGLFGLLTYPLRYLSVCPHGCHTSPPRRAPGYPGTGEHSPRSHATVNLYLAALSHDMHCTTCGRITVSSAQVHSWHPRGRLWFFEVPFCQDTLGNGNL